MSLLAALADEPRLRLFALVLLEAPTTAHAATRTGLREKDVLRSLTRLEAVGLVSRKGHHWQAHPEVLRDVVAAAPAPQMVDHGADDPEAAAVLRTFMPQGRLEQIPVARNKRLVVLDHICRVFEPGERYSEREVSVLLEAFHSDYAALRRYLVDEGFLTREAGTYWRSGGTVVL
jgi:hypothetical protein